ncbi:MAG: hypothetical protein AB7V26_06725 [Lysobacterales bacterium]
MVRAIARRLDRVLALALLLLAVYAATLAARAWQVQRFESALIRLEASRHRDPAGRPEVLALAGSSGRWVAQPVARLGAAELELRARWQRAVAERSGSDADRRAALRAARIDLQRASALRPDWPYASAALAEVLAAEGSFGVDLRSAFQSALARGPNEPRLLRQLLDLALAHRQRWPATLETDLRRVALRLDAIDPHRLLAIAQRRQALDWLCAIEGVSTSVHNACRSQARAQE